MQLQDEDWIWDLYVPYIILSLLEKCKNRKHTFFTLGSQSDLGRNFLSDFEVSDPEYDQD